MNKSVTFSSRIRKVLIILGLSWNLPLFAAIFFSFGRSDVYPIYGTLARFFLTFAIVLLARNIALMWQHDFYRTKFYASADEVTAISSRGRSASGRWDDLISIKGRSKPPSGQRQLTLWLLCDLFLLGRDVNLVFLDGTKIVIPRVGLSFDRHPILKSFIDSNRAKDELQCMLYNWAGWHTKAYNSLDEMANRKFGDYPSASMYKWYFLLQIPWIFTWIIYLAMYKFEVPDIEHMTRYLVFSIVMSPLMLIGTATIHLLLWRSQRSN